MGESFRTAQEGDGTASGVQADVDRFCGVLRARAPPYVHPEMVSLAFFWARRRAVYLLPGRLELLHVVRQCDSPRCLESGRPLAAGVDHGRH